MNFIKDNGGILAVLGVVIVMLGAYNEWRTSVAVSAKLEASGMVDPATVEANRESIRDLEQNHAKDSDRMDGKIERIIDILLEE